MVNASSGEKKREKKTNYDFTTKAFVLITSYLKH